MLTTTLSDFRKDIKRYIDSVTKNFETFIPVAYGKAFPYDTQTFEKLLETDLFAPYGWVVRELDDEQYRIAVGLYKMRIN